MTVTVSLKQESKSTDNVLLGCFETLARNEVQATDNSACRNLLCAAKKTWFELALQVLSTGIDVPLQ